VLLLIFAGVTGWAWLTGATTDCGCFGTWLKRTPQEAALEALTLLIATLLAWVGLRHLQPSQTRAKTWTVSIACLIGLTLPLVFGFPLSRINQAEWKVGQMELGDLEIHGLDHIDLKQGEYIINLMDTDCLHCQESVEEFNALAQETDLPVLIGLCINEAPKLRRFVEEFQPIFPIGQIREDVFWRLMAEGDLPRTILVRDGRIQQVWDKTVPDKDMIKVALSD
jgi:hypothetical protein